MQLNEGQSAALDKIFTFLCDPEQSIFVLNGYSGYGKTTVIKELINRYDALHDINQSLGTPIPSNILLAAMTHKAASLFESLTTNSKIVAKGTYHSVLGLTIRTDYSTGKTITAPKDKQYHHIPIGSLLLIDEASMLTDLRYIKDAIKYRKIKVLLIGDEDQLVVGRSVFKNTHNYYPSATLLEPMRNSSQIFNLAHEYRKVLHGGSLPSSIPLGQELEYIEDRQDFIDSYHIAACVSQICGGFGYLSL